MAEKIEFDNVKLVGHWPRTTGIHIAMSPHVILLTDAHEAPAYELIEALRLAGVKTLIEGLREAGLEAAVSRGESASVGERWDEPPIAVLYEVIAGADMVELHAAIEHATTSWPVAGS